METNYIAYQFLGETDLSITLIDNGHINSTFLIESGEKKYILQKINTNIFKFPKNIIENHLKINEKLRSSDFDLNIINLVSTKNGDFFYEDEENNFWRMQDFVEDTTTHLKVPNAETAYRAAEGLGKFYHAINQLPGIDLGETLPDFINFEKRINDYLKSLETASEERKKQAENEISFVNEHISLPNQWIKLQKEGLLPERIIHADPKISNILFGKDGFPTAIIDLDTVMKSTLLYDFGDMMRSYCNLTDEDDAQLAENFGTEIYTSVKNGFLSSMNNTLQNIEKQNLDYAAQVVIYIQAVRFLTDFLNNDIYYGVKYPLHNLDRTKNQINLLKNLIYFLNNQ